MTKLPIAKLEEIFGGRLQKCPLTITRPPCWRPGNRLAFN